jgi:hypothetical protein
MAGRWPGDGRAMDGSMDQSMDQSAVDVPWPRLYDGTLMIILRRQ